MRFKFLFLLSLPAAIYAQETVQPVQTQYPNHASSGSADVRVFDNQARQFNDWSISIGGGAAFIPHGDLTSFYGKDINWGWNAYGSIDKQFTHVYGLSLQYQIGKTNQQGMLPGVYGTMAGVADAYTKFQQVSLINDINLSNLMRRVDNYSDFRWSLHGYVGFGLQTFETLLTDKNTSRPSNNPADEQIYVKQKMDLSSFFAQGGVGLKYKISPMVDIEARTMYILTGDDEFDGGGYGHYAQWPAQAYNKINSSRSDNAWTVNLGLSFKLGRHAEHLAWVDPLQDLTERVTALQNRSVDPVICEKGDMDNDGICDDWDRQLNTPAGARVDGAGVALDMDMDTVIDLNDKCVTTPGSVQNDGCPTGTGNNVNRSTY